MSPNKVEARRESRFVHTLMAFMTKVQLYLDEGMWHETLPQPNITKGTAPGSRLMSFNGTPAALAANNRCVPWAYLGLLVLS